MDFNKLRAKAGLLSGSLLELIVIPSLCIFYFMNGSRGWQFFAGFIGILWLLMMQKAASKDSINDMLEKAMRRQ